MTRLFRITAMRTGCGALIIINYVSRYYGWLARRGSRTASLIRSSRLDSMWHNRSSDVAQRQSPDQFHRCPHATAASESGIVWVGPADDDDDDCGAGVGASHGHPWQLDLNFPFQIFQSKDRLDILFEEYHGFVRLAMDPAKPPRPDTWVAPSDAAMEIPVIETTDFQKGFWLDVNGTPASKMSGPCRTDLVPPYDDSLLLISQPLCCASRSSNLGDAT